MQNKLKLLYVISKMKKVRITFDEGIMLFVEIGHFYKNINGENIFYIFSDAFNTQHKYHVKIRKKLRELHLIMELNLT
jgi:hypothetical protein